MVIRWVRRPQRYDRSDLARHMGDFIPHLVDALRKTVVQCVDDMQRVL
ncbi:hypothetical protein ACH4ZX_40140 [Streptomyces sp. NPDC020490]